MTQAAPAYVPPFTVSLWVIAPFGVALAVLLFGITMARVATLPVAGKAGIAIAVMASVVAVMSGGIILVQGAAYLLTYYSRPFFESKWVAIAAFVLGLLLFWLRSRRLYLYAAIELAGAMAAILVCALSTYGTASQRASALLGAVYFLIRGLDNADKGKLLEQVRANVGALIAIVAFFAIIGAAVAWGRSYREDVRATRFSAPVSPERCGDTLVFCNAGAWREHWRLRTLTPAQRAQAEQRRIKAVENWDWKRRLAYQMYGPF